MMGDFFKGHSEPVEPTLKIYELGQREHVAQIDRTGMLWVTKTKLPKILFADVPVPFHMSAGFMISPMEDADELTGPER